MLKIKLPQINSDHAGFNYLSDIYHQISSIGFEDIALDFQDVTWFDANMLAVLGAVIASGWTNSFYLTNLRPGQEKLFRKNRFLSHFGVEPLPDSYRTTVEYRKSKISEVKAFEGYLNKKLLSRTDLPDMSDLLRKKIKESILEIFNNADTHGQCGFVYSCGQYYPKKGKLDFTIVDIGNTIMKNVSEFMGQNMSGKETIEWAVRENTSTRKDNIPGGLGFNLIRNFLNKNGGKIQIASADGYWQESQDGQNSADLNHSFGGTAVNLEFNTNDNSTYCLSTEIQNQEIPF